MSAARGRRKQNVGFGSRVVRRRGFRGGVSQEDAIPSGDATRRQNCALARRPTKISPRQAVGRFLALIGQVRGNDGVKGGVGRRRQRRSWQVRERG